MNDTSPYSSEFAPEPQPDREAARRRVNAPAIGLIVVGALNALYLVASTVLTFAFDSGAMMGQQAAMLEQYGMSFLASPAFSIGTSAIGVAVSAVMILGGLKMRALEAYGLAFAAAILTCLPCMTCCCAITMPFGIWALIVLLDANVKQAFR